MTATSKLRHIPGDGSAMVEGFSLLPLRKAPNAPRHLCDVGKSYWRSYTKAMITAGLLFEPDLSTLEDLCYWEAIKHRGRDELPSDSLFMEYRDSETGLVTHTQPHAAFSNLKSIQSTIAALRAKLGLTIHDRSGLKAYQRSKPRSVIRTPKTY